MKVELKVIVGEEYTTKIRELVNEFNISIGEYFCSKSYGDDLLTFSIHFLLVQTRNGYENWYIPKKPKYIDYKVIQSRHPGIPSYEIRKEFFYEFRFDDNILKEIIRGSSNEAKQIISEEILKSLSCLDKLPKKIKDFDRVQFVSDFAKYFNEQVLK